MSSPVIFETEMFEEIWTNISSNLWFQLTLLLTVAIASSFLFARVGQPKIIGLIVLGIIIGPSLLGLIKVDPDDPSDMVHNFAQLGAIIILFMIGLECNIKEIYTKRNVLIAIGGVSVPWITGYLLAEVMLPAPDVALELTKFTQSIFIGTALVATSVAITVGVMREMGIIGSNIAKTIIGAAVVDDIIAMVVLAITTGVASGGGVDVFNLSYITIAAVLFVVLGSYFGSHFVTKIISRVERRGIAHGIEESGFLLALSLALIYAVIAESIGISAIVGAFIAGTSFSASEYRMRYMKWGTVIEWVFAPIFFLSLGIIVNLQQLDSLNWLLFAFALAGVAIVSKVIGCGIPARILGMNKRESVAVGLGMSPRMEVVMIIAVYAITREFITNQVYSSIIIMGLITVLIAPTLLRRTLRELPREKEKFEPK